MGPRVLRAESGSMDGTNRLVKVCSLDERLCCLKAAFRQLLDGRVIPFRPSRWSWRARLLQLRRTRPSVKVLLHQHPSGPSSLFQAPFLTPANRRTLGPSARCSSWVVRAHRLLLRRRGWPVITQDTSFGTVLPIREG